MNPEDKSKRRRSVTIEESNMDPVIDTNQERHPTATTHRNSIREVPIMNPSHHYTPDEKYNGIEEEMHPIENQYSSINTGKRTGEEQYSSVLTGKKSHEEQHSSIITGKRSEDQHSSVISGKKPEEQYSSFITGKKRHSTAQRDLLKPQNTQLTMTNSVSTRKSAKFNSFMEQQFELYSRLDSINQWKIVAIIGASLSVVSLIEIIFQNNSELFTGNNIVMLALTLAMFLLSVIVFVLLKQRQVRMRPARIYFPYLLLYGICLTVIDHFSTSVNPPGYIYCFLCIMYTASTPNVAVLFFIGTLVVSLDVNAKFNNLLNPAIRSKCEAVNSNQCINSFVASALYCYGANLLGFMYCYLSLTNSRGHFLTLYKLWEEEQQLKEAGVKAEAIALSIIPKGVWEDFRKGEKIDFNGILSNPLYIYEDVTILFADIVGFTNLSGFVSAQELIQLLNQVFFEFDKVVEIYNLEKIKTLGDCYMLCGGMPEPVSEHALRTVFVGTKLVRLVKALTAMLPYGLQLRVGIHSGKVMAGILGEERIIFDVWSEDVLIASKMEQTGKPSYVHLSDATKELCEEYCYVRPGQTVRFRDGTVERDIPTWFLNDINPQGMAILEAVAEEKSILPSHTDMKGYFLVSNKNLKRNTAKEYKSIEGEEENSPFVKEISEIHSELRKNVHMFWLTLLFGEEQNYHQLSLKLGGKQVVVTVISCILTGILMILKYSMLNFPLGIYFSILYLFFQLLMALYLWQRKIYAVKRSTFQDTNVKKSKSNGIADVFFMGDVICSDIYPYLNAAALITVTIISAVIMPYDQVHAADLYLLVISGTVLGKEHWYQVSFGSLVLIIIFHAVRVMDPNYFMDSGISTVLFSILLLLIVSTGYRRTESEKRMGYLLALDLKRRRFEVDDVRIKAESLLYKLLPKHVVDRLKANPDGEISDFIDSAGILFCCIDNLTGMDMNSTSVLNDIITNFDHLLDLYGVEKIKTIGASATYMAACGLIGGENNNIAKQRIMSNSEFRAEEKKNVEDDGSDTDTEVGSDDENATGATVVYEVYQEDIAKTKQYKRFLEFAIALRQKMSEINIRYSSKYSLQIGVHIGPLVAGVIGKNKFSYDVWGDTVNVASRMESSAALDQIQVSEKVYLLLDDYFEFEHQGVKHIKGKGLMNTYVLLGRKEETGL